MRQKSLPYWLAAGTEICHACTLTYVLEMEYRCCGCDAGLCEQCAMVVRESLEVYCRECLPGEG